MPDSHNILAPVILSASRSTDIPSFYSEWMVQRLREGYCTWRNPFNQMQYRVEFNDVRCIVFWSKNPEPLRNQLTEIENLGFKNYYFQFTLNDYERENLEPGVPALEKRIETFKRLSDRIGKERVIWRFDPLLLSTDLTEDILLERIKSVGERLKGYTEKLVFSFADIEVYKKVRNNLKGTTFREFFSSEEKLSFIKGLCEINKTLDMTLATCAEEIDLSSNKINHNKCIDDDLMIRLFPEDTKLMDYLGAESDMFDKTWRLQKSKKDKGQRKACGCVMSKDIGSYDTCPHQCRYCYANRTPHTALQNYKLHKNRQFQDDGLFICKKDDIIDE